MAGKMNTQLDKTHSLIQQTNSSLSVAPVKDNDDTINAKIAELESKYAKLEATFGKVGPDILVEGRANLPMSIKRELSNETEFGRDDLLNDVK